MGYGTEWFDARATSVDVITRGQTTAGEDATEDDNPDLVCDQEVGVVFSADDVFVLAGTRHDVRRRLASALAQLTEEA
jgi:hypothetical protein